METMLDQAEATIRERIRDIPDGTYRFVDHMDDWGPDTDPIKIVCTVEVDGDEIAIDFDGTDSQTESGLNSYFNYTCSYTHMAVKCLTDPFGPMNGGAIRPISISAPEGCFLNPRRPAGGGPRAIICHRIFEVVVGALAPAIPDRVAAAGARPPPPTARGPPPPPNTPPRGAPPPPRRPRAPPRATRTRRPRWRSTRRRWRAGATPPRG
jgi:N-methylhydantoinase B